jgi:hypothetical protein
MANITIDAINTNPRNSANGNTIVVNINANQDIVITPVNFSTTKSNNINIKLISIVISIPPSD